MACSGIQARMAAENIVGHWLFEKAILTCIIAGCVMMYAHTSMFMNSKCMHDYNHDCLGIGSQNVEWHHASTHASKHVCSCSCTHMHTNVNQIQHACLQGH